MREKIIGFDDLPLNVRGVVSANISLQSEFKKHNPSIPVSCADSLRVLEERITRLFYIESPADTIRRAEVSDEQLDKERRRGWRLAVWVSPEEAELITARFASEHEAREISPEAWAALGSKADAGEKHG